VRGVARRVKKAERSQLVGIYEQYKKMGNEMLRRLIVEKNRIDILATVILRYEIKPFHLKMLKFQFEHPDSLQLTFRGAGKSTVCTIVKAIHLLCKDRNIRILLASKNKTNAEGFLKEIKAHLEGNAKLIEVFGAFFDPAKVTKWDNTEIDVLGRTQVMKEASITCVGVESAVVSKHYDVIISDDLVDEDNARTKHMREKTKSFYYQTLDPTLMPPDPKRAHVGEHHRLGTRYHFDDLYGHFEANELKEHTNTIPALDAKGRSPWPEKYPPAWLQEKKRKSGTIIFNAQYQCDTEAMKGEIFQYDHCQQLDESEWPDERDLFIFGGVDLAIKAEEQNDKFAIAIIGVKGKPMTGKDPDAIYILDWYEDHVRFPQQRPKIIGAYDAWEPIRVGIEANGFQLASLQDLKEERPNIRAIPIYTDKDKITRAWKLAALFEAGKVFFKKGLHGPLIDRLILFPNVGKDIFDAIDLAVHASKKRRKRRDDDRKEPGLL
jgi:phage terminase large subunit-like protein